MMAALVVRMAALATQRPVEIDVFPPRPPIGMQNATLSARRSP